MCGINLIIDKKGVASEVSIRRMTAATAHRGPDATTFHTINHTANRVYFGHNRLKIIDLSEAANQPFLSEDGRFALLFNGEVYNYKELRKGLILRGCSFRTQSDTEVILQLLILEGQRGIAKLNGMFAIAFYDSHENRLWLARDRFGIKPLYYAETPEYLLVSSEIKAIIHSGLLPKELNEEQIYHYLRYKHAAKPQTFFRHIHELKEGTALFWEKGKSTLHPFIHTPPSSPKSETPEQFVHHIERLLADSIERHLVSDVPVGLFLSGGIDSTLLLAALHRAGHHHFPAFSITHKSEEGSFGTEDGYFARMAAEQYKANHTIFEIDDTILTGTDAFVQHLDQPIADGAGLLTGYLAEQVKPYIKVALSGAGADELFGGYNRHRAFYHYLQNQQTAVILKYIARPFLPLLPTGFNHPLRKQFTLIHKLGHKIQKSPRSTFLNFTALDQQLTKLLHSKHTPERSANSTPHPDWLAWCLRHDQHHYLISDILAVTDQASMQHSLEVRTPYLENHLQLFLNGIEADVLFSEGQKWVLKEVLQRHNGEAFLRRSKEGFGMPLGNWLKKPGNQYLLEELNNSGNLIFEYIAFAPTQKLLHRHRKGRQDLSSEIWALLVLAKWLKHNFG